MTGARAVSALLALAATAAVATACSSAGGEALAVGSSCGDYRAASTAQQDSFAQGWIDQTHPRAYDGPARLDDVEYELSVLCAQDADRTVGAVLSEQFDSAGTSDAAAASPSPPSTSQGCATSQDLRDDVTQAVTTMLSYDYRNLAADVTRIRAVTTPDEFARFDKQFRKARPLIVSNQAVSDAAVVALGFSGGDCTSPEFLVAADQKIRNTNLQEPRVDNNRLQVTMSYTSSGYLLSQLQPI